MKAKSVQEALLQVDGIYSPAIGGSITMPKHKNPTGLIICPRCAYGCTRKRNLQEHFPKCIRDNGNPDSLRHDSHESWPRKDQEEDQEEENQEGENQEEEASMDLFPLSRLSVSRRSLSKNISIRLGSIR